jgi:hypothetical protein
MKLLVSLGGDEDIALSALLGCQLGLDEKTNAVRRPKALKAPRPRLSSFITGGLAVESRSPPGSGQGQAERYTSEDTDLTT